MLKLIFIVLLIIIVVIGKILTTLKPENKYLHYGNIILIVLSLIVLVFWDDGMVYNGKIHITERKMKIEFLKADREFTNQMKIGTQKKLNIKATCKQGRILLTIYQKQKEHTYDISEWNNDLELSEFEEGYINLHLKNINARHVKVEINSTN